MVASIEAGISHSSQNNQEKRQGPFKKAMVEGWRHFRDSEAGHRVIRRAMDIILEKSPESYFEWSGEYNLQNVVDAARQNHKIVIIANHQSHGDAAPVVHVIRKLNEKLLRGHFRQSVYTMSATMGGGQQGKSVEVVFNHGVLPFFEKHNITPDNVVSTNDMKERMVEKPEDNAVLTMDAMLNPDVLSAVHVEGKTKSGKKIPGKEPMIFGLQPMDANARGVFANQLREGIPTLLVPLSIEGSRDIFDPDAKDFNIKGLIELAEAILNSTKIGKVVEGVLKKESWYQSPKMGSVVIGKPRYLSQLREKNGKRGIRDLHHEIMRMLAENLTPFSQGDYGKSLLSATQPSIG